jgi:hypothetical protein
LNPLDINIEIKIKNILIKKVNDMISIGRNDIIQNNIINGYNKLNLNLYSNNQNQMKDSNLILIRLKVDYDKFASINQQRFGALFVGQVANPSELLLLSKKSKFTNTRDTNANGGGGGASTTNTRRSNNDDNDDDEDGSGVSKANLEELVTTILSENRKMGLLPPTKMEEAMDSFVQKKNINAISDAVHSILEKAQKGLFRDLSNTLASKENISLAALDTMNSMEAASTGKKAPIRQASSLLRTGAGGGTSPSGSGSDIEESTTTKKRTVTGKGKASTTTAVRKTKSKAATSRKRAAASTSPVESEIEDSSIAMSEDDFSDASPIPKKGRATTAAAKKKATIAATTKSNAKITARPSRAAAKKKSYVLGSDSDGDGDGMNVSDVEDEDDVVDDDDLSNSDEYQSEIEEVKPKRGRGTANTANTTAKKIPTKNVKASKKQQVMDLVSDSDPDDILKGDETETEHQLQSPTTTTTTTTGRGKGKAAISQVKLNDDYSPSANTTQMSISASGATQGTGAGAGGGRRRRALPGSMTQGSQRSTTSKSASNQEWA